MVCCCTRSPQTSRRSPAGDRTVDAGRSPSVTGRAGLSRPVRLGRRRRDVGAAIERQGSQRWIVFTDPAPRVMTHRRERPSGRAPATSRALTCSDLVSRAISRMPAPEHRHAHPGRPRRPTQRRPAPMDRNPAAKNDETAVAPQHDGGLGPRTRSPGPRRVSPDRPDRQPPDRPLPPGSGRCVVQRRPAACAARTAGRRTRIRISATPTMRPVRTERARRLRESRFMRL